MFCTRIVLMGMSHKEGKVWSGLLLFKQKGCFLAGPSNTKIVSNSWKFTQKLFSFRKTVRFTRIFCWSSVFLCVKLKIKYFFNIGRSGDERRHNNNNNLERSKGGESSSLAEEHRQLQEKYKAMQERLRSGLHAAFFFPSPLAGFFFMSNSSDPCAKKKVLGQLVVNQYRRLTIFLCGDYWAVLSFFAAQNI